MTVSVTPCMDNTPDKNILKAIKAAPIEVTSEICTGCQPIFLAIGENAVCLNQSYEKEEERKTCVRLSSVGLIYKLN